ncbi:MAG: hypothetical protein EXR69_14325 [Myxococcales bacterium]|nr:hypothetical protein [Myxococcales bacterium]
MLNELTASIMVMLAVGLPLLGMLARYRREERQLLQISLVAHFLSAIALIVVYRHYYRDGGDILNYYDAGLTLTEWMKTDFLIAVPEVGKLILQLESVAPLDYYSTGYSAGNSTATMCGFSAIGMLLVNDSLYAVCMLVSCLSFLGKLSVYTVFRDSFPVKYHRRALLATMLVPSVVFWSAGLVKEAFALSGLGYLFLGVHRVMAGRRSGWLLVWIGGGLIAMVKPYILFSFVLSAAIWYYWARAIAQSGRVEIRPLPLVVGTGLAVVGIGLLGTVFPDFALSTVGEAAGRQREVSLTIDAGSSFNLGASGDQSVVGQLAYAPLALLTTLFRPTIFEVNNPVMFINAMETMLLTTLLAMSVWRRKWIGMWRIATATPLLMFCLAFTVSLGVAVGLTSANLGTLSRYRIPMMPFFGILVLMWSAPGAAKDLSPARMATR